jgi:hypothetical protein
MLFKNSVRTSKRTPHFTITEINWLTLFKFKLGKKSDDECTHALQYNESKSAFWTKHHAITPYGGGCKYSCTRSYNQLHALATLPADYANNDDK